MSDNPLENEIVTFTEAGGTWAGYTVQFIRYEDRKGNAMTDEFAPLHAAYARVKVIDGPAKRDIGKEFRIRSYTYNSASNLQHEHELRASDERRDKIDALVAQGMTEEEAKNQVIIDTVWPEKADHPDPDGTEKQTDELRGMLSL